MSKNTRLILKSAESALWIVGAGLFALHLFSWRSTKSGIYYETINEWGIAVGVMLIMAAWVLKRW